MLDSVENPVISLCVWLDPSFVAMCEQDGKKFHRNRSALICGAVFGTHPVLHHSRRMTAMNTESERRLYQIEQLPDVMQLDEAQIDWLISTGQLRTIRICGQLRIDSHEVGELIATYHRIAKRKQDYVQ